MDKGKKPIQEDEVDKNQTASSPFLPLGGLDVTDIEHMLSHSFDESGPGWELEGAFDYGNMFGIEEDLIPMVDQSPKPQNPTLEAVQVDRAQINPVAPVAEPQPLNPKKRISSEELASLALQNPKRAKKIMENRLSAARSKEKKATRILALEQEVQKLRPIAAALSSELESKETEKDYLNVESNKLRLEFDSYVQQIKLQDALNDQIKEEMRYTKLVTERYRAVTGGALSGDSNIRATAAPPAATQRFPQQHQVPYQCQQHQVPNQCQQQPAAGHQNLQQQQQQAELLPGCCDLNISDYGFF